MSQIKSNQLGETLRKRREELKLSSRKLAGLVGVTSSSILRIESGDIPKPKPEILSKLAEKLELSLTELYTIAGYPIPSDMPEMAAYLRTKYHDLPETAREEVNDFILYLHHKHGLKKKGPQHGEDE
jgi:transcriptional regulator with XRE-family HTH domain